MNGQTQQEEQKTVPEELFQALKVVGKFAEASIGYVEVWDENEIVIRNVKTEATIELIDLSEETPNSLLNKLAKLNKTKSDES